MKSVLEIQLERISQTGDLTPASLNKLFRSANIELSTPEEEIVYDLTEGMPAHTTVVTSETLFAPSELAKLGEKHSTAMEAAKRKYKAAIKGVAMTVLTAGTALATGGGSVAFITTLKNVLEASRQIYSGDVPE